MPILLWDIPEGTDVMSVNGDFVSFSQKFSVDSTTGEVTLITQLDRMVATTEQFTIEACDTGALCE